MERRTSTINVLLLSVTIEFFTKTEYRDLQRENIGYKVTAVIRSLKFPTVSPHIVMIILNHELDISLTSPINFIIRLFELTHTSVNREMETCSV